MKIEDIDFTELIKETCVYKFSVPHYNKSKLIAYLRHNSDTDNDSTINLDEVESVLSSLGFVMIHDC